MEKYKKIASQFNLMAGQINQKENPKWIEECIQEELAEYAQAETKEDLLDSNLDVMYFICNYVNSVNFTVSNYERLKKIFDERLEACSELCENPLEAFYEVHRSNMSKFAKSTYDFKDANRKYAPNKIFIDETNGRYMGYYWLNGTKRIIKPSTFREPNLKKFLKK